MELAALVWFDVSSGEGSVALKSTGELLYLNYTCFPGLSPKHLPNHYEDVLRDLEAGEILTVTIYENLYSRRVDTAVRTGTSEGQQADALEATLPLEY